MNINSSSVSNSVIPVPPKPDKKAFGNHFFMKSPSPIEYMETNALLTRINPKIKSFFVENQDGTTTSLFVNGKQDIYWFDAFMQKLQRLKSLVKERAMIIHGDENACKSEEDALRKQFFDANVSKYFSGSKPLEHKSVLSALENKSFNPFTFEINA